MRLEAARAKQALAKGADQIPERVFGNEDGKPLWRSDCERPASRKIFSEAAVPGRIRSRIAR